MVRQHKKIKKSSRLNITKKLRKVILSYDLLLVYANAELKIRESVVALYKDSKDKSGVVKLINAKAEMERFSVFIQALEKQKYETLYNLELILSRFPRNHRLIFYKYFIQQKKVYAIAKELNLPYDECETIKQELFNEIIYLYR